jgi:protocatechuate 3,4-dioxygenase, beta subunit
MNNQEKIFSRRQMLKSGIGFGGLVMVGGSVFAQQKEAMTTPAVDLGPFYPVLKPLDQDADLTTIKGNKGVAAGTIIHVAGRLLDAKGKPISGAKIEIWQANTHGRYAHKGDTNDAPLDPHFQGYGVIKTDHEGRYRFKTIKPGAYPTSATTQRTPHIHFDIEGSHDRLVSQMFFPNEPLNEKDGIFMDLHKYSEKVTDAVTAKLLPPTKEIEKNALLFNWDIVLSNG